MRFTYQTEHLDFLRENYPQMGMPELTQAFNKAFGLDKTQQQIRSTCKNHKIRCNRRQGDLVRGRSVLFNAEQVEFIKQNYRLLSREDVTTVFNEKYGTDIQVSQITAFTKNHKIKSGRSGRFQKNNVSWNKGTKGKTGRNRTSFKKGAVPVNRRDFGEERLTDGYRLVKVDTTNPYTGHRGWWRHKQVVVWEQLHGPVPPGMVVAFKDGNRAHCDIENLELRSRGEHLALNRVRYNHVDMELRPTVRLLADLAIQRGKLDRQVKERCD